MHFFEPQAPLFRCIYKGVTDACRYANNVATSYRCLLNGYKLYVQFLIAKQCFFSVKVDEPPFKNMFRLKVHILKTKVWDFESLLAHQNRVWTIQKCKLICLLPRMGGNRPFWLKSTILEIPKNLCGNSMNITRNFGVTSSKIWNRNIGKRWGRCFTIIQKNFKISLRFQGFWKNRFKKNLIKFSWQYRANF